MLFTIYSTKKFRQQSKLRYLPKISDSLVSDQQINERFVYLFLPMATKSHIVEVIKNHKNELFKFGIRGIGIFGSFARAENKPGSDLDILIDFEPDKETFDNYMAVYDLLEKLFKNQKLDVVTKNGLSPYIGPKILNEVLYV